MEIAEFIQKVNALKDVKRTGWVERGVKAPESVAEHSYMMAVMCMVLFPEDLDKEKVVKMAPIHDIAEAETGDIISKDNWEDGGTMTESEKIRLEEAALKKMLSVLDDDLSWEFFGIWSEFNEGKTKESRFVRDIDVAQRTIQAFEYNKKGNTKKPMEPFWDSRNLNKINNQRIKKLVEDIILMGR